MTEKVRKIQTGAVVADSPPKVSVVIPAYKIAGFISETIRSAIGQTFRDHEIIVVNDGSPDSLELENALAPFKEQITYIVQENQGAAAARNTGIRSARGSYIAFLDGDDIWQPEYLESQLEYLRANDLQMVYCDALMFGDGVRGDETFMSRAPSNGPVTTTSLLSTQCNVITSGTVCLREAIVACGLFDEKAIRTEDFDLWFRLIRNGVRVGYQKKVLLKYRVRNEGLTGDSIAQAERSVKSFELIKAKYRLSETELSTWRSQMRLCVSDLESRKGKDFLSKGRFKDAVASFRKANAANRTIKSTIVYFMAAFAPRLLRLAVNKLQGKKISGQVRTDADAVRGTQ